VDQALKKLDENIMENRNRTGLLKRELKKLKLQVIKFNISDVKKLQHVCVWQCKYLCVLHDQRGEE
jgi:hypothetical protein